MSISPLEHAVKTPTVHLSRSAAETEALGELWAREARRGWVIGLSGDLGTGKTCLVRGLARGLGIRRKIQSPSFALLHEYTEGRLPLFHLDLYRLESREQIIAAGLEPCLTRPDGVTVAEWIEHWRGLEPSAAGDGCFFRRVRIETLGETTRRITYEDIGG